MVFHILIIGEKGSMNRNLIAIQAQNAAKAINANNPVYKYSSLNANLSQPIEAATIKHKQVILPRIKFKKRTVSSVSTTNHERSPG
jgi:hypothetical protein